MLILFVVGGNCSKNNLNVIGLLNGTLNLYGASSIPETFISINLIIFDIFFCFIY